MPLSIELTAAERKRIVFPDRYLERSYFFRFARNITGMKKMRNEVNLLLAGPFNEDTVSYPAFKRCHSSIFVA